MFNVYGRVYIEGFDILSDFRMDWISEKKVFNKISCVKPVIAKSDDDQIIYTGFLSASLHFYKCPFSILYCQLNSINFSEIDQFNRKVIFQLSIFDKNFDFIKTFTLSYKNKYVSIDFEPINYFVNFFNRSISKDYSIFDLPEQIDYHLIPQKIDQLLIEYINGLIFKKYSCSKNRGPGKDSAFWEEIYISNLTRMPYLNENIYSIIKDKENYTPKRTDNNIILENGTDYGYVSVGDEKPKEIEIGTDKERILDYIKLNILNRVDIDLFTIEFIKYNQVK